MTADRPAQDLREPVPGRIERAERGLPAPTILSICDRLLGEVGRRHHMFGWLKAPGAGAGEWLAVDAYYPRARLVVMCRSEPGPNDAVYRDLIPAHGLGLLTLDPPALGNNREAVTATLAAKVFDLERVPRPRQRPARPAMAIRPGSAPEPQPAPEAVAPAPEWTPLKVERTSVPRGFVQAFGVLAGLAFAALLIVELYLGVIVVAIGDGRLVLGLAIVLEALSRALGTVAAERAGERGWAFGCAIVGAPVVVVVRDAAALRPRRRRAGAARRPARRCSRARSRCWLSLSGAKWS